MYLDQVKALILIIIQSGNNQTAWQMSLEDGSIISVAQDLETFLKGHYKKPTKDQPKPVSLFQNQTNEESLGEILAITQDGKALAWRGCPASHFA